jgi:hypothetical protein
MKACKSIDTRHDRSLHRHSTSRFPKTGWLIGWRRGLSSWFRSLERELGQSGLELVNSWLLGTWRCQPIPVVDSTRYPATKHLRPRGHARI